MSCFARRALSGLSLLCLCSAAFAAGPAIGLAVANGNFHLDHSTVWGNATLFDGNVIETGASSSQIQLHNGVNLRLAAESRARVYESRLVLEKGIGQLESANYRIDAGSVQVAAEGTGAEARVQINGHNRVTVASREGEVLVSNTRGVLIAKLETGREMTFEPQENAGATVTKLSGILSLKDGKFVLVDRVTNVTMQLQGPGLEAEVGHLVEVTGTVNSAAPTVPGASQLIDVATIKRLVNNKRVAGGAAGAGAAGAAAGAAAGGISTGATVAIIGGVAAAGTIGGLAAAHALPGQGSNQSSASR